MIDYLNLPDEQLVAMSKQADDLAVDTLIRRYKGMVVKISRSYYLIGAELDDLIQEGMLGLYKSIIKYNENDKTKFVTFAYQCVKNSILDAIKQANSFKNRPLNESERLDNVSLSVDFWDRYSNIFRVEIEEIIEQAKEYMSDKEKAIFELFLDGYKTKDIAETMNMTAKSVDNAIYRIKKKINKFWENESKSK